VAGFPDQPGSPSMRIRQGLGLASEDRKTEGLALARSIEDNITLSALKRHMRFGLLDLRTRRSEVLEHMRRLAIRARWPTQRVSELSGGNQQKVALARLLHQRADIFLLDEPTRGIDIGSKAEIYRIIDQQAAQGRAILMASSYLPELFGVCDRIAVLSRGAVSPALATSEWTEHRVMEFATRGTI
jgi:ribose transport system ATP-binding protein